MKPDLIPKVIGVFIVLITLVVIPLNSYSQPGTWTEKKSLRQTPQFTEYSITFSVNGKGYFGTGRKWNEGIISDEIFEYDPVTDEWTRKANFPGGPRRDAVGFSIGSKGYLATGHNDELWEYDPTTDLWKKKANFPGGSRANAVAFSIGDKGYLGTGWADGNPTNVKNDFWEYDPALDKWTRKADVPGGGRTLAAGFSIGNKGYLGSGSNYSSETFNLLTDFYEYDPGSDNWTKRADFAVPPLQTGSFLGGVSLAGKGYFEFKDNNQFTTSFWEYDPIINAWSKQSGYGATRPLDIIFNIAERGYFGHLFNSDILQLNEYNPISKAWAPKDFKYVFPPPPAGRDRYAAAGFTIGNFAYIGAGTNVGPFSPTDLIDFWKYDPAEDKWTQIADFPSARPTSHAVGFNIGDKGYLLALNNLWEYDPISNTWTGKSNFPGSAKIDAVAFSIGNKGYLGSGGSKDFWEYDGVADKWTRKSDYPGLGNTENVGFSIGSKGYVGLGKDINFANDFWEYDPVSDQWTKKADYNGAARIDAVAFAIGSKGYVGLGVSQNPFNGSQVPQKDFWEYKPSSNTWANKASFPTFARSYPLGISVGSKGYVGFGKVGSSVSDWWEYAPPPSESNPLFAVAKVKEYYSPTSIVLDASASTDPNGSPLSFSWKKIDGPDSYTILFPDHAFPNIVNLVNGTYTFRLTAKNSVGETSTDDISFTIKVLNQPPIAKASIKEYYSATSVVFDGSGSSDPEGKPLKYSWKKTSGPDTYNILFPDHAFPNVVNLVNGNYTFELTVTDDQGATSSNYLFLEVKQNNAPIAKAWLAEYKSSNSVLLSGWASYDPDGGTIKYAWTKVAGPSLYTISGDDSYNATVSNLLTGTYTFRLTVADMGGSTDFQDVTFDIKSTTTPANAPPIAKAWLALYNSSSSVLLSGWASYDPEGKPITYQWSYVSGPSSYTITDGTSYNATINNLVAGSYTFRLTVKDDLGQAASEDVTFVMNAIARINASNDLSVYNQSVPIKKLEVYPNPATNMLQYKWSSGYMGKSNLSILDMSGRELKTYEINKLQQILIGQINVTNLKAGAYYLHIRTKDTKQQSMMFIKK